MRGHTLAQCKQLLRELLVPSILVHFYVNSHKLRFFDFKNKKVTTYPLYPFKEQIKGRCKTNGKINIKNDRVSWCLLNPSKIFFTDPWEETCSVRNYTFETRALKLTQEPDFELPRTNHYFIFFEGNIWSFGGL